MFSSNKWVCQPELSQAVIFWEPTVKFILIPNFICKHIVIRHVQTFKMWKMHKSDDEIFINFIWKIATSCWCFLFHHSFNEPTHPTNIILTWWFLLNYWHTWMCHVPSYNLDSTVPNLYANQIETDQEKWKIERLRYVNWSIFWFLMSKTLAFAISNNENYISRASALRCWNK